ncbi:MAG: hypothetical protein Q4A27_00480 [bacterium]|nr:hypothetical protein [bacterium]
MKKISLKSLIALAILSGALIFNSAPTHAMQVDKKFETTNIQYLKNFNEDIRVSSSEFEEIKASLRENNTTAVEKYFKPELSYNNPLVSREYEIVDVETEEEYEAEPEKYSPIYPDHKIERFIVEKKDPERIFYIRTTLTFDTDDELRNNLSMYSWEYNEIGLSAFYPYESIVPQVGEQNYEMSKCEMSLGPCLEEDERLYVVSFLTRVTLDTALNGAGENQANGEANGAAQTTPQNSGTGAATSANNQNRTPNSSSSPSQTNGNEPQQKISAPNTGFNQNSNFGLMDLLAAGGVAAITAAYKKIRNSKIKL